MNDSQSTSPSVHESAGQWPRDFDFRAEYAEQQELLQHSDDVTTLTNSGGTESDE